MKKIIYAFIIIIFISACSLQNTDNIGLIEWYNKNQKLTRTIKNGYWSNNSKDAPTNKDLIMIMDIACKVPTAGNWNEFFFIAVKDPKEQEAIIGDYWGKGSTSNGTVTILILVDKIAIQNNHKSRESYFRSRFAYFDAGMASSLLSLAANTLGYNTHFFGIATGKAVLKNNNVKDYGPINYDISRYLKGKNYTRSGRIATEGIHIEGNCILIACIVIGKPNPDIDVKSSATQYSRPSNWAIWDVK